MKKLLLSALIALCLILGIGALATFVPRQILIGAWFWAFLTMGLYAMWDAAE